MDRFKNKVKTLAGHGKKAEKFPESETSKKAIIGSKKDEPEDDAVASSPKSKYFLV